LEPYVVNFHKVTNMQHEAHPPQPNVTLPAAAHKTVTEVDATAAATKAQERKHMQPVQPKASLPRRVEDLVPQTAAKAGSRKETSPHEVPTPLPAVKKHDVKPAVVKKDTASESLPKLGAKKATTAAAPSKEDEQKEIDEEVDEDIAAKLDNAFADFRTVKPHKDAGSNLIQSISGANASHGAAKLDQHLADTSLEASSHHNQAQLSWMQRIWSWWHGGSAEALIQKESRVASLSGKPRFRGA